METCTSIAADPALRSLMVLAAVLALSQISSCLLMLVWAIMARR